MRIQLLIMGIFTTFAITSLSKWLFNRRTYAKLNAGDPDNEFEMHYELIGDPVKPVLVLTPGLGAGMSCWTYLKGKLKDFRVLIYDPRGMYKSGHTADYEISDLASDLNELLNHLGIDKASMLGWSMGGVVVQYFAYTYPEKVDRLILLATSPSGADQALAGMDSEVSKAIDAAGIALSESPSADDLKRMIPRVVEYSSSNRFIGKILSLLVSSGLILLQSPGYYESLAQQWIAANQSDTYNRLGEINAPTLLIHGTNDRLIPYAAMDVLKDALSNTDVTTADIPDGGHGLPSENPKEVASIISEFLKPD